MVSCMEACLLTAVAWTKLFAAHSARQSPPVPRRGKPPVAAAGGSSPRLSTDGLGPGASAAGEWEGLKRRKDAEPACKELR